MARQLASLLPHLLLLAAVVSAAVPPSSTTSPQNDNVKPGCQQSTCGNLSIPYPFGIGASCYRDESFNITCNGSTPTLGHGNIEVVSINLTDGLLTVNNYLAYDCYDQSGRFERTWASSDISGLPNYKFSNIRNKFIAVGCDTDGYVQVDDEESEIWIGCNVYCNNRSDVPNDGNCSGIGCCSAPIPKDLRSYNITVYSFENHTQCWDFSPCGFAFVTDVDRFKFYRSTLTQLRNETYMPVTLDWAIMGRDCAEAQLQQQGNKSDTYACVSPYSNCFNSDNGPGYLCKCKKGFQGNPYLRDGCQDIDECATEKPCVRKCRNSAGDYSCSCPWHMYGDGKIGGSGCKSVFKIIYLVLVVGFGLLVAIFIIFWVYYAFKKKRMMEFKEKFFRQNGGLLLREQHRSIGSSRTSATKLFSLEELQTATDNYNPSRILGEGGAGTVYKGVLPNQTVVAIKKAKVPNELEVEQFINEVNILSNINHRNVVCLLGCCLEDQVPMLIYEFVPNGTLSHHIHSEGRRGSLSLRDRLRIAAEVAGALSYLHSAASVPIIHRDIKSTNILLDDNLTAKVADFGASRLVPLDQNGLVSLVRGTFGYLDPEYLLSGQFTDKSDVYSFGVVLVELLTGENPIDKSRPVDRRSLAAHFTMSVESGQLFEVMESRVREEGTPELLVAAAELAKGCLSVKGESRPMMKEVAMELEGLRRLAGVHPWDEDVNPEEAEQMLRGDDRSCAIEPALGDQYDSSLHGMVPLNIVR